MTPALDSLAVDCNRQFCDDLCSTPQKPRRDWICSCHFSVVENGRGDLGETAAATGSVAPLISFWHSVSGVLENCPNWDQIGFSELSGGSCVYRHVRTCDFETRPVPVRLDRSMQRTRYEAFL